MRIPVEPHVNCFAPELRREQEISLVHFHDAKSYGATVRRSVVTLCFHVATGRAAAPLSPLRSLLPASRAKPTSAKKSLSPNDASGVADELLMVRYQRGDRKAFATLVERHHRPLYNFVLRLVADGSVAEELTQETFLRVVQRAADFKHEARFSTWLYAIARNLSIDHLRKRRLRQHPSLDQSRTRDPEGPTLREALPDLHPRSNVERTAVSGQIADTLLEAVAALPEDQREVYLLREIANLPFKEIAEATDSGENTVKSRMRYALERLKLALGDFEEYARELK